MRKPLFILGDVTPSRTRGMKHARQKTIRRVVMAHPKNYKGGSEYANVPKHPGDQKLPEGVSYREYDVRPHVAGIDRGEERIVIGDDGSVWYTDDHYVTFTRIE